jgi:hypothetical protein
MPILSQTQISSAGPIRPSFAITFGPQEATRTPSISFEESGNFLGLEYSSIPLDDANWDGRMPYVPFLAQWDSSQSSDPSDYGYAATQLGNANHLQAGRKTIHVANSWTVPSPTGAQMCTVSLGKRKEEK